MDRRAQAANYLIDTDHGVIVDVEATRAIRQAEVGAAQTMIERTETGFGMKPDSLVADSAYGSAESLDCLVNQKAIKPFIPVLDRSSRTDGTFSRDDFAFDPEGDRFTCPAGKELIQYRRAYSTPRSGVSAHGMRFYRASKLDCDVCEFKPHCCPNAEARKVPRHIHEDAPGTRLGLWLQRLNTRPPATFGRRLRCCLLTSSGSFGSRACA